VSEPLELIYLTPSRMAVERTPTRSASLLTALLEREEIGRVTVLNRLRPTEVPARLRATRPERTPSLMALASALPGGRSPDDRILEHPWPFGAAEDRFVERLAQATTASATADAGVVLWVADPKSASVFDALAGRRSRPLLVFDAFDAWDLSPLVTGRRRLRAVTAGYAAAARSADIIFANTPAMAQRFASLGARSVHLLPNASPSARAFQPDPAPYVVYVGRVHERFDAPLVTAVARALPDLEVRIAGPVVHPPVGWDVLAACANVHLLGSVPGPQALALMGGSRAVLVPHLPDDYTRSQDSMKAWDAIAVGAPVISTGVPPVSEWRDRPGLGRVADDAAGFIAAIRDALASDSPADRSARRAFAQENGWAARAADVARVLVPMVADLGHGGHP